MNWLERARREVAESERARCEISKRGRENTANTTVRITEPRKALKARTANTAERNPTAVTAVRQPMPFGESLDSNGSNGSTRTAQKPKPRLCHANEVALQHSVSWESEGLRAADEWCVWCAGPAEHDDPLLLLGFAGTSGLLHEECWLPWYAQQKERASMALNEHILRGSH